VGPAASGTSAGSHLMNPFFRRDEFYESPNSCGISYIQGLAELGPPIYEMASKLSKREPLASNS